MSMQQQTQFRALNGLRGLGALIVIFDHVEGPLTTAIFQHRMLAVDFFFCLSGFVLAHAYGRKFASGELSPLGFMRARLIRLYPLYLLGTILGVGSLLFQKFVLGLDLSFLHLFEALAIALFLLPCPNKFPFQHGELFPLNNPSWSLFFELFANLIYAVFAKHLTLPRLLGALPIFAGLLIFTAAEYKSMDGGWAWYNLNLGFGRVLFPFFAGVALYKLRDHITLKALPLPLVIAAFLGVIAVPLHGLAGTSFEVFAALVLMPLLVFWSADTPCHGRAGAVCDLLGYLSYGIYMVHLPFRAPLVAMLEPMGVSRDVIALILAIGAAGLAYVATRYYDGPARKLLNSLFSLRPFKASKAH